MTRVFSHIEVYFIYAVAIVIVYGLQYMLSFSNIKLMQQQNYLKYPDEFFVIWRERFQMKRFLQSMIVPGYVLVSSMLLSQYELFVEFWAGGYLVFLLSQICFGIFSYCYHRSLCRDLGISGEVSFSLVFSYKVIMFRVVAMGVFMSVLSLIAGRVSFLGAAVFLLATAAGFLRQLRVKNNKIHIANREVN